MAHCQSSLLLVIAMMAVSLGQHLPPPVTPQQVPHNAEEYQKPVGVGAAASPRHVLPTKANSILGAMVFENSTNENSVPSNSRVAAEPLFYFRNGSQASWPFRSEGTTNSTTTTTATTNGTTTTKREHYWTMQTPVCASNSTLELCEEDSEYNEDIADAVRAILKDSPISAILRNTAATDSWPASAFIGRNTGSAHARIGPEGNYTPTCAVERSIIAPRRVQTENGTWVFAINQDDFVQNIFVEKCIRGDRPCHLGFSPPPTVQTKCKQNYITHLLYTLSDSGQNVTNERVLIPSCCTCYVSGLSGLETGH